MKYALLIKPSARKELLSLPDKIIKRIDTAINKLSDISRPRGCIKLTGIHAYRLRVGDYRIIYTIDDKKHQIEILAIGHRREIYR